MKMERLSPRVTCSPVKMERLSPRVTCSPVKMESSPVKMESSPVKMESSLVKMESSPVKMESSLVKMESSPVKMERLSPRVTCSPVKMESSPVKMESSLVKIESSPVKMERPSPKIGLETVKSGIKSLESFAELDILPLEARPVLKRDVGIMANIMEQGNSFVNYECLMEECLDMVKVDEDMQRLLIQTLHVLNRKLTKYYSDGDGLNAAPDGVITPLTIFAEKIEQLISELSVITSERGVASHKPHGGVWEEALTEARFGTLPQTAVDTVVEPLLFNCAE
ncbi:uncharacterized protein [Procambarus clarkii]|uniref:uncharacterized protein isoform X2 n=1 Tax=Procambarus clarkii TaxID=6728 RepID=UPI0037420895